MTPGVLACADCGSEFSSFDGDTQTMCGNCAATTHLSRCGQRSPIAYALLAQGEGDYTCTRPKGHMGMHTYGRKRS